MTDIARTTRLRHDDHHRSAAADLIRHHVEFEFDLYLELRFRARNFGFSACLTASYEVDFWGKNRTPYGRAHLNVSRFDCDVVEISTVAAVLNAYSRFSRRRIVTSPPTGTTIAQQVMDAINARLEWAWRPCSTRRNS
jgi:hypothetical protein